MHRTCRSLQTRCPASAGDLTKHCVTTRATAVLCQDSCRKAHRRLTVTCTVSRSKSRTFKSSLKCMAYRQKPLRESFSSRSQLSDRLCLMSSSA